MMVEPAILPEKALVGAGGDQGLILDRTDGKGFCRFTEGFLDTDAKSCSLRFVTQAEDISTEVDESVLDPFFLEVLFDAIGDIALGDGSEIEAHAGGVEGDSIAVYMNFPVIYESHSFGKFFFIGDHSASGGEIPEGGDGLDGDIEGSFGKFSVGEPGLDKLCGFLGNFADLAVVQPVNFAFRQGAAEKLFIVIAEGEGPVQKFRAVRAVERDCHQRIEVNLLSRDGSCVFFSVGKIKASPCQKQEKEDEKRALYLFHEKVLQSQLDPVPLAVLAESFEYHHT